MTTHENIRRQYYEAAQGELSQAEADVTAAENACTETAGTPAYAESAKQLAAAREQRAEIRERMKHLRAAHRAAVKVVNAELDRAAETEHKRLCDELRERQPILQQRIDEINLELPELQRELDAIPRRCNSRPIVQHVPEIPDDDQDAPQTPPKTPPTPTRRASWAFELADKLRRKYAEYTKFTELQVAALKRDDPGSLAARAESARNHRMYAEAALADARRFESELSECPDMVLSIRQNVKFDPRDTVSAT